jgi:hypothetical protein
MSQPAQNAGTFASNFSQTQAGIFVFLFHHLVFKHLIYGADISCVLFFSWYEWLCWCIKQFGAIVCFCFTLYS